MARMNFVLAFLDLLLLCNVALGGVVSSTLPVSCQDATAATVDGNLLFGTWYEAARKTGIPNFPTEQCVQLIIQNNPGSVSVLKTFSLDPNALYMSETINTTVTYDATTAQAFFTASFDVPVDGATRTYKFLETDYENYALICEYVSSEKTLSTSGTGAFILTRRRQVKSRDLARLTAKALHRYSDFQDLTAVNQSNDC